MLTQVASPFDLLTDDPTERSLMKLKADLLILLTMDYDGGEEGLARFAKDNQITREEARSILTGELSALSLDLLATCLFRKGWYLKRQLVSEKQLDMQFTC